MRTVEFKGGYLLRLDRGEEITDTLERFLEKNRIHGGTVTGLGGIEDAELGYYDLPTKTYQRTTIPGNLELIVYSGNITLVDGKPFVHAHAVVSGPDFRPHAGHFFQARVALTGEFVVQPADWEVAREEDARTGLKLMDLSGE
jgi:predicted DNA-binding protein with PD1-like motif